jgi:hypothetical protein
MALENIIWIDEGNSLKKMEKIVHEESYNLHSSSNIIGKIKSSSMR